MENNLSEKEKKAFCYLHESTTLNPLRNSCMISGYTGHIPGKLTSCSKPYIEETKEATAVYMKRRLQKLEYEATLIKNLKDFPDYFSLWYEIPRDKHHVCDKCINTNPENMKKGYCNF